MAEPTDTQPLAPADAAEYIATMAGELSAIAESARLDGLATILYAAQLEARRALRRSGGERPLSRKQG